MSAIIIFIYKLGIKLLTIVCIAKHTGNGELCSVRMPACSRSLARTLIRTRLIHESWISLMTMYIVEFSFLLSRLF